MSYWNNGLRFDNIAASLEGKSIGDCSRPSEHSHSQSLPLFA